MFPCHRGFFQLVLPLERALWANEVASRLRRKDDNLAHRQAFWLRVWQLDFHFDTKRSVRFALEKMIAECNSQVTTVYTSASQYVQTHFLD